MSETSSPPPQEGNLSILSNLETGEMDSNPDDHTPSDPDDHTPTYQEDAAISESHDHHVSRHRHTGMSHDRKLGKLATKIRR